MSSGDIDTNPPENEALMESENPTLWQRMSHPAYSLHRYIALVFMCLLGFGNYFVYDTPGALQKQITEDMVINTQYFALLYSLYSWPNVFLCFFGGFLNDKIFGIRLGAIIFATIVLIGQLIFAFGAFVNRYWIMLVGRFVFGIGGESLAVSQNTYAVSWFKGKELNMVFGLQLSIARVGSSVNFLIIQPIYDFFSTFSSPHTTLGLVLLFGAFLCFLSLVATIIVGLMDKRAERLLNRTANQTEEVRLSDFLSFPFSFWTLSIVVVCFYIAIFPFVGLATVFFMQKYDYTSTQASQLDGIIYLISAVASPILGIFVDLTGKNLFWIFGSISTTLVGHLLICFTFMNPWYPMVLVGIGYSILACALWPMVSMVIPEHQLGSAYGMMQAIQNFGLAVAPIIAGVLIDYKGYIVLETFFIASVCLALTTSIVLYIFDSLDSGYLNMTPKQRKTYIRRLKKNSITKAESNQDQIIS